MAQVINTNSLSLMAQNNLNKSQSSLGTAIERLSSGLRINSAKDDAAGQAISNRFTANIKGLTQASRNANDGISLAQTTEGALNEVNDNLQNIRRLTVQAQNGSNSSSDLQSIQDEITQRLAEINRISEQTDFNGVKVLSGEQNKLTIQVGANDGETIDIDLGKIDAGSLGLDKFNVANGFDTKSIDTEITSFDKKGAPTIAEDDATSKKTSVDGIVYSSGSNHYIKTDDSEWVKGTLGTNGEFTFDSSNSSDVVGVEPADLKAVTSTTVGTTPLTGLETGEKLQSIKDDKGQPNGYVVQGKDADGKEAYFKATVDETTGKVTKGEQLSTEVKTEKPLEVLDKALSQVDQLRSSLGAVQNRFDSVINNLNSTVNNLSASQSRIQDADYATEVSNMSRANILQQAGTSVLAQANQSTQNVLSLLR
ncbi:FliC/FljB family flagellin [Klebsiella aerogenes]|nr:FliC/FljB family flagellin [Klebsiella aerogenes]